MLKQLFATLFSSKPSCKDVDKFLGDYLEGILPQDTATDFDAHISKCPKCLSFFEQYKKTIELTNTDSVQVPDELAAQTLAFLNQQLR